jgi:transposase
LLLPNSWRNLRAMKAYSNDLRRALIAAYETHDYSQRQVAALFGVSPATVRNLVRRKRDTGTPDALCRAGGKRVTLGQPVQDRVRQLVAQRNDLTLAQLCEQITQEYKTRVSVATMCRLLHRLGLRRKKRRSMRRNVILHVSSRHD